MGRPFEQAGIQAGDVSAMAMMNIAVNGFRNVSQENGEAAVTIPGGVVAKYVTDQEYGQQFGSMVISAQRVANPFPSMPGIAYGTKYTCATAQSVLGANDFFQVAQPIEGNRIAKLGWGTALGIPLTSGRMLRPNFDLTLYIRQATPSRTRFTRCFCPANQDTFIRRETPPDVAGTWAKDNSPGLYDLMTFAAGANVQGAPDVWQSGSFSAGADVSNLAAVAGQSVTISGLVMFPGIVPISKELLPLIARLLPDETQLCQWYWRTGRFRVGGACNAGASYQGQIEHRGMRATPSFSWSTQSYAGGITAATATPSSPDLTTVSTPNANSTAGFIIDNQYVANARM